MAVESGPLAPQCLLSPYNVEPPGLPQWPRFVTSPRAKSFARHISIPTISTGRSPGGFLLPQMAVGGEPIGPKKNRWWFMVTLDVYMRSKSDRRRLRYLGSLLEGMFQVAGWCSLGVLLGDAPFVLVCLCFVCFALRMSLLTPRLLRSKQRQYSVSPWSSLAPLDFDRSKTCEFPENPDCHLVCFAFPSPKTHDLGCWDMPVWLACQNILCLHHLLPFFPEEHVFHLFSTASTSYLTLVFTYHTYVIYIYIHTSLYHCIPVLVSHLPTICGWAPFSTAPYCTMATCPQWSMFDPSPPAEIHTRLYIPSGNLT